MGSLTLFEKYRNFEFVNTNELNSVVDYICHNLNTCWSNYSYWYDMYCYATKSRIVIRHKQERKEAAVAKLGQCVCKNEVINFLENASKKCNCEEGCASVYFNVVFSSRLTT